MHLAQAAEVVGSNSTLLGALISGTLIVTLASAYRFVVNFRTTERGMARQRIKQAAQNERSSQHEASLWQARCGDLEYAMRRAGLAVPPLSKELQKLVFSIEDEIPPQWDDTTDRPAGDRQHDQ